MRFIVTICLLLAGTFASAQSFDFGTTEAYNPLDGATEVSTLDVLGTTYKVYRATNGKTFINLRGRYFVWSDFKSIGTHDGQPVYQSPSGTPFIFAQGSKGPYAKYGKRG